VACGPLFSDIPFPYDEAGDAALFSLTRPPFPPLWQKHLVFPTSSGVLKMGLMRGSFFSGKWEGDFFLKRGDFPGRSRRAIPLFSWRLEPKTVFALIFDLFWRSRGVGFFWAVSSGGEEEEWRISMKGFLVFVWEDENFGTFGGLPSRGGFVEAMMFFEAWGGDKRRCLFGEDALSFVRFVGKRGLFFWLVAFFAGRGGG